MTGTKSLQTEGCAGRAPDGEGTVADRKRTGGSERHPNSMANLRGVNGTPPATAWKPGAAPHMKHGGRTRQPERSQQYPEAKGEVVDTVERSVPIRGPDGEVLPEFELAVHMTTIQLIVVKRVTGFLQTNGWEDERGELRLTEIEAVQRALDRMRKWLRELAGTPAAWASAGYDVARTREAQTDLAVRWSKQLAEERAGLDLEDGDRGR